MTESGLKGLYILTQGKATVRSVALAEKEEEKSTANMPGLKNNCCSGRMGGDFSEKIIRR